MATGPTSLCCHGNLAASKGPSELRTASCLDWPKIAYTIAGTHLRRSASYDMRTTSPASTCKSWGENAAYIP